MSASSWWCLSRPCVQSAATAATAHSLLRPSSSSPSPLHHRPGLLLRSSSSRLLPATRRRHLLTLAIETSCDDTCVAILEKLPSTTTTTTTTGAAAARLHFNEKITSDNRHFRGVHPLAAVVSHTANLAPLIQKALRALPLFHQQQQQQQVNESIGNDEEENNMRTKKKNKEAILYVDGQQQQPRLKPDFVSVTRGPGMTSNLATGLNTAKGLAVAWGVPLVGVNHMQAHALTPRLVAALKKGEEVEGEVEEEGEEGRKIDDNDPAFPFLSLLVSGGHTLLVRSRSLTEHAILAQAMNIAIGDMLDKCARVVLPGEWLSSSSTSSSSPSGTEDVMYGALLEKFVFPDTAAAAAAAGNSDHDHDYDYDYEYTPPARRADEILPFDSNRGWGLTPPLSGTIAMAYDFAGFNSQVQRAVEDKPDMGVEERRFLGKHAMRLAFEHLVSRLLFVLRNDAKKAKAKKQNTSDDNTNYNEEEEDNDDGGGGGGGGGDEIKTIVVSGGVASNRYLMHILRSMLAVRGFGHMRVVAPPPALCTDNAAMVAWAGVEMYEAGWRSEMDVLAIRKWPLDPAAEGGGILGAAGWRRREQES